VAKVKTLLTSSNRPYSDVTTTLQNSYSVRTSAFLFRN